MARVFISYRRQASPDDDAAIGRLADRLRQKFGDKGVFRDKESNLGSLDWRANIERQIRSSKVVLVWVDQRWLDCRDRLDLEDDVLRWELGLAIRLKKRVLPVLVAGVRLPNDLPTDLLQLSKAHALELLAIDGIPFDDGMRTILGQLGRRPIARTAYYAAATLVVILTLLIGVGARAQRQSEAEAFEAGFQARFAGVEDRHQRVATLARMQRHLDHLGVHLPRSLGTYRFRDQEDLTEYVAVVVTEIETSNPHLADFFKAGLDLPSHVVNHESDLIAKMVEALHLPASLAHPRSNLQEWAESIHKYFYGRLKS